MVLKDDDSSTYISFSKRLLITPATLAVVSSCLFARIKNGVEDNDESAIRV